MDLLIPFIAPIGVLANVMTASRLICFRRGCSRYRPGMSLLAYLLIVCSGGQAIDTIFNRVHVSLWEAGFSVVIALLVIRARGNVAHIVRAAS
jgi:hypothetical protein